MAPGISEEFFCSTAQRFAGIIMARDNSWRLGCGTLQPLAERGSERRFGRKNEVTREEIIETLINYLDQQLTRTRAHIAQPSSKAEFFALFKEAYANRYFEEVPNLKADALREVLVDRWSSIRVGFDAEKRQLIDEWSSRWEEWRYALENYQ
jgi:hypothetical protein